MKYIKKYESFEPSEQKTEPTNEIFGFSEKEKLEKFKKECQKYIDVWVKKGAINQPTEEELEKFYADAKADKYEGKIGIHKTNSIMYRASKDVKWGMAGQHSFGEGN